MPMWYAFVDADVARVRRRAFQSIPFIHNTPKRTTRNQVREGQFIHNTTTVCPANKGEDRNCVSIQLTLSQHVQRKLKYVKGNTSHTLHSLHSYARDMQRVPRSQTRIRVAQSPYPGSTRTFGLNPRATTSPGWRGGVWTVADTHTGMT